jgi:hypothetical protein
MWLDAAAGPVEPVRVLCGFGNCVDGPPLLPEVTVGVDCDESPSVLPGSAASAPWIFAAITPKIDTQLAIGRMKRHAGASGMPTRDSSLCDEICMEVCRSRRRHDARRGRLLASREFVRSPSFFRNQLAPGSDDLACVLVQATSPANCARFRSLLTPITRRDS